MFAKQSFAILLMITVASAADIPNRLIDYDKFQAEVGEVRDLRAAHRVTESQFLRMSKEPATVILDARSAEKFALLHVRGAHNLSLPDITSDELAKVIPSKTTRVLIYCNNNFLNAPQAFPSKLPSASLNVHTMSMLYAYGYTNVYELGPLIDIRASKLEFDGELATPRRETER